jgi:hypothetical protein
LSLAADLFPWCRGLYEHMRRELLAEIEAENEARLKAERESRRRT